MLARVFHGFVSRPASLPQCLVSSNKLLQISCQHLCLPYAVITWHFGRMRAASRVVRTALRSVTTRAAVCTELGAPLTIRDDWVIADPGPGEVLVATKAAGLNFAEVLQTKGLYQERLEPPFVPGNECSGIVEVVGAGVSHVKVGDSVVALPRGGAWARHCVVNGAAVAPLPKTPTTDDGWRQAASLAVAYGTADLALRRRAKISEGETVLITAAAGGVGLAAVELAAHAGCRVIAATGSPEKAEIALAAGASAALSYGDDPRAFKEHIKELAPNGLDVAVDMVGGPHLEAIVRSMAFDGRCVVVGFASGDIPKVPANLLLVKNCSLVGLYWGAHATARPEVFRESLARVVGLWAEGRVSPRVGLAVPLREANGAVAALAGRKSTGKVVLTMDDDG